MATLSVIRRWARTDTIAGEYSDAKVSQQYRDFERQRGYSIESGDGEPV